MKVIKYIQLYNYLMSEEGLNPISAYRSIQRVRKLPVEMKQAVVGILNGEMPALEYHDVTLGELTEKEHMKPIRALLMLDWIRREPAVAMRYLETERLRAPMQFSEADQDRVKAALERLKAKETVQPAADESDIEVEE